MRRERKEELRARFMERPKLREHTRTYTVRCCRKDHKVAITPQGDIILFDHGKTNLRALYAEGMIKDCKDHGCYYLAHVILHFNSSHGWEKSTWKSRRSKEQKRAFDAGLPDPLHYVIAEILSRKGKNAAYARAREAEEYKRVFIKEPWHRVEQFIALRNRLIKEKMFRVQERMKAQGIPIKERNQYGHAIYSHG